MRGARRGPQVRDVPRICSFLLQTGIPAPDKISNYWCRANCAEKSLRQHSASCPAHGPPKPYARGAPGGPVDQAGSVSS
ncbi:MAG: hypothetical protein EBS01_13770 [Verrucomicrobia bacterium]|nr:hypothetical protein [Verrucomicrobiota bacterium]